MTAAGLIHRCFWKDTTEDRMAWTAATRGDYVRASGTYASDVTDREWALIAPSLPAARPGGRPRSTVTLRRGPPAQGGDVAATCPYGRS